MLGTAAGIQPDVTELTDNSVDNRLTESVQVSKKTSNLQTKYLVEESAFHRFVKRGKGLLALVGQRLSFVFAKYAEVPSALDKAFDRLTGGRGPGYLVKIILLFLLLIAIGFGVEKLFNVTIQKHIQQLQSTIPNSFFQLIARLSGRTLLELLSFAVFAFTIVVVYLLFYPTDSPLHQLAVVYLPPIFIIRRTAVPMKKTANAIYTIGTRIK
jgi:Fe2+ transport system protein B